MNEAVRAGRCASSTSACRASPTTSSAAGGDARRSSSWRPPAGGDVDAGLDAGATRRRPARSRPPTRPPSSATSPPSPCSSTSCSRARRSRRSRASAGSCTPARRSPGSDMCGPMQGAIIGAIALRRLGRHARRGAARWPRPARSRSSPATTTAPSGRWPGIISPSMPVWVVENADRRQPRVLQLQRGARQGAALRRQRPRGHRAPAAGWATELAPALRAAVAALGGLELKPLMAQALHMGDEVHNRNAAATALLFKRLAAGAARSRRAARPARRGARRSSPATTTSSSTSRWRRARRCSTPPPACPDSSMVTAMARNGVDFGIRLAAPATAGSRRRANPVDGLFFPGYAIADAAADLGDSAITETAGLGGFAMAAAPAIVQFVGGTPADAIANTPPDAHDHARHATRRSRCRALNFGRHAGRHRRAQGASTPASLPVINTGIAHREAGVGQIGAGVTTAPMACFIAAVDGARRAALLAAEDAPDERARRRRGRRQRADPRRAAPRRSPTSTTPCCATAPHVVDMVDAGWNVVLTHGNGPQVGFILRRSEIADRPRSPRCRWTTPSPTRRARSATCSRTRSATSCAGAASTEPVVAVVTQTLVDRRRSGVRASRQADRLVHGRGRRATPRAPSSAGPIAEDAGRGWRRMVASPQPARDRRAADHRSARAARA